MQSTLSGPDGSPEFPTRWRGYDRGQVDAFLEQTATERQRWSEGLAHLDQLAAAEPDGPAATVAVALREAQAIWVKAEERARRLIRDAEQRAESLRPQQLDVPVDVSLPAGWATRLWLLTGQTPREHAIALVALVAVCGILLVGFMYQSSAHEADPATSAAVPVIPDHEPPVRAPETTEALTDTATGARGQIASATQTVSAQVRPSAAQTEGLVLTLSAQRLCWIRTTIDDGEPVERLMQPHDTILLHAHDAVVLRVGDAAALSVLINQQPARPFGGDGVAVTRRITRANYASLLLDQTRASARAITEAGQAAVFN